MFTETQKAKIRMYLGYPDLWRYKNTRLEGVWNVISPEGEAIILTYLAKIETIEAEYASLFSQGALKRVDDIEFFGREEGLSVSESKMREACLYASRISTMLGVPFYADAFGQGGYPGDSYSSMGLADGRSGRGGPIPLG